MKCEKRDCGSNVNGWCQFEAEGDKRPSSCTLDAFVGDHVHLAYYHTGFIDDPPVLLDVCDSVTAADEAIIEHQAQRDRDCEYRDKAKWWNETRGIRTANGAHDGRRKETP